MTNEPESQILSRLFQVLEDRKQHPNHASYTCRLLEGGVDKIGAKISEEAAEVVEAAAEAGEEGRQHLVHEAADLAFHLLVMLVHAGVTWRQVEDELGRRFGISGLDEKASRKKDKNEEDPASDTRG